LASIKWNWCGETKPVCHFCSVAWCHIWKYLSDILKKKKKKDLIYLREREREREKERAGEGGGADGEGEKEFQPASLLSVELDLSIPRS